MARHFSMHQPIFNYSKKYAKLKNKEWQSKAIQS